MTDAPRRHTRAQLEELLDLQAQKIEKLEEELRIERLSQQVRARRASYGNGARQ